jgi:hypothetical protein
MSTKSSGTENGIERRTRRAVCEPMAIDAWAHPEGSGLFDVYSGSNAEPYVVDLPERRCSCPDDQHNLSNDELCKHGRRVRFALGIEDVPAELREDMDGTLAANRRKFGADPEPEPDVDPITVESAKPSRAVPVATDGGRVLEAEPRGESPETALPEITEHVEPPEQGGARFIRCEGCEQEVIGTDESRLVHREGCAHAVGADHTLPAREEPQRSEPADFGGGESTGVQDL